MFASKDLKEEGEEFSNSPKRRVYYYSTFPTKGCSCILSASEYMFILNWIEFYRTSIRFFSKIWQMKTCRYAWSIDICNIDNSGDVQHAACSTCSLLFVFSNSEVTAVFEPIRSLEWRKVRQVGFSTRYSGCANYSREDALYFYYSEYLWKLDKRVN